MPQFVIVMTAEGDTWDHLTDTEQADLLARYDEWVGQLSAEGAYVRGAAAGRAEAVDVEGTTTPVTGERITGLFTVEAQDHAAAAKLAAGCPAFSHGESVVVYELT